MKSAKRQSILFSGSSNKPLAKELAVLLDCPLGQIEISKFSDGETYINIKSKIKDKNVFVLQSCSYPTNHHLLELLIIIDAIKRLQPKKITVILPFYAYRRQEKKTKTGESVTAQLVARLLEATGADGIITIDIHADKILSFFKIPIQNLEATPLFVDYFKKLDTPASARLSRGRAKNLVVVAPDRGALKDAQRFAKKIGAKVSYIEKRRAKRHDKIESMKFYGSVKGKDILMIDDEIDTAGTLLKAAQLLESRGARNIYAACTHPVFSGEAVKRLKKSPISQIIVTNTICLPRKKIRSLADKLQILSIATILANAIKT